MFSCPSKIRIFLKISLHSSELHRFISKHWMLEPDAQTIVKINYQWYYFTNAGSYECSGHKIFGFRLRASGSGMQLYLSTCHVRDLSPHLGSCVRLVQVLISQHASQLHRRADQLDMTITIVHITFLQLHVARYNNVAACWSSIIDTCFDINHVFIADLCTTFVVRCCRYH